MAATIGALRVVLGADTVAFEKGIKGAETRLSGFSRTAKVAGAAIGAALGTVAVGAAISFAASVRNAIDEADKMGKMAQSIGIPIEALSKLKFAGELADVSLEQLGTGVTKLSKSLIDAARDGASTSAQAFRALGVDIRDASGNVKDAETIILEVADAFNSFEDGAGKTAVAAELFGRSVGAKMVPLLNSGSAALRENFAEAEKLGLVYTTDMAAASERFNDNLTRLSVSSQGLAISVANALLPALNDTVDVMLSLGTGAASAAPSTFSAIGEGAKQAAINILPFVGALKTIKEIYDYLRSQTATIPQLPNFDEFQKQFGDSGLAQARKLAADQLAASLANQAQSVKDAAAAQREHDQIMAQGVAVYEATRTPMEAYADRLKELQALLSAGAIDADTFSRAQTMAAAGAVQPWIDAAGTIGGALSTLFGQHKEVAMAMAAINTAQGITAALAQYPPPLSFVMAGLQAAAGAAQIAAISAQEFHQGGIVGAGTGRMRQLVDLRPDEQHAVLQKGEGVFTKEQMAAMGGDTFNIEVNAPGADASTVGFFRSSAFRFAVTAAVKDAQSRNRL